MATVEQAVGGVSFALTDEQKELRALAREFATKEIRPKAAEYDVAMQHPADVIAKAHELGLMNLHVPGRVRRPRPRRVRRDARRRGAELGLHRDRHLDRRERARRRPRDHRRHRRAEGDVAAAADRAADPLLVRALRARCRLRRRAPEDDRRAPRRRVRPERLEDVHHERRLRRLDGRLREDRRRRRATAASRRSSSRWTRRASRSSSTSTRWASARPTPRRSRCRTSSCPAANRLGEEGDGFKLAMQTLDFTRPGTAIGAVGVAQAAYELAVDYAKERVTFDVPIAMHQGVNFMIADMATEIEAARLLTWQAAWMLDQGSARRSTRRSRSASPPTRR